MEQYDVKCPICGTMNKGLYMRETNGWMICEHCQHEVQILEFVPRDNFSKSFYKSPAWLMTKKKQLERQPFCEECLKKGERVKATMVDHIVPIKQGGDKYNPSNLQSLCWACHSRKSAEEGSRWGRKPRGYDNP